MKTKHRKFQVCICISNWEIYVQKIIVKNSYFDLLLRIFDSTLDLIKYPRYHIIDAEYLSFNLMYCM